MDFLKSYFLLILLTCGVFVFIIKGIFLSLLVPVFQNPDEQIHYARVQHWAESVEKTWSVDTSSSGRPDSNPHDIRSYRLTPEVVNTGFLTGFDTVKFQRENVQDFVTGSRIGKNELSIVENTWERHVEFEQNDASGTVSVYYLAASWIERLLTHTSIFDRILAARLLSVFFGLLIVILAYLTVQRIGFTALSSLLFSALVAFQPMFSITAAQINIDISLIFAFSLFLFAGVSLIQAGPNWKYTILTIFAALLGFYSKGPGIVLIATLVPLFMYVAYEHFHPDRRRFFWSAFVISALAIALFFLLTPPTYIASITNLQATSKFESPTISIGKYLGKTITTGELRDTTLSYWGHFGWLDSSIPNWTLSLIILIMLAGFGGTLWYIFSKGEGPGYLPERKYLVFFLGLIILLQVAIRFYDWRIFDQTGRIIIGQPGRYFLPNLIGHFTIIVTGLGFLVRQRVYFTRLLQILVGGMILLQIEAIVNVIIPRYYL